MANTKANRLALLVASLFLLLFYSVKNFAEELDFDVQLKAIDSIRSSDNKKFIKLLSELEAFHSQFNTEQKNYFKYLKVYSSTFSGDLETALKLGEELIHSNVNAEIKFRTNLTLLNLGAISKNWSKGMEYLTTNLKLLESVEDIELKQLGQLGNALMYNQYGQFETSLDYIKDIDRSKLTQRNLCLLRGMELEAKIRSSRLTFNSPEIEEAKSQCIEVNEPVMTGFINLYQSQLLVKSNQPDEALGILLIQLSDIEKANYRRLTIEAYAHTAEIYLGKQNNEKAKEYALKAISNKEGLETTKPAADAHNVLYQIALSNGDNDEAFKQYKLYVEAEKAYLNEVSAKALAFQLAQQQAVQQKADIALLNKQNELLNSNNELLKIEQSLALSEAENTRLVAALLMAIVTLLTFFGYRSWRTQRRLKTLAEYDYLTKVFNRGHFMTLAEDTLTLATKTKHTVTCIIFDLDKFKNINDSYGHTTGDWALKATVAAVQECIRDNDILARLGGEEFVILLPSCDTHAATYVAEKCIRKLQAIDTAESGHAFTITASFGITTSKISGFNIATLIAHADEALYQSKSNGRNQYTLYGGQQ